jgi:8-oxo-dGTP pyrophosphatase MutT (NUDIX family)
MKLHDFFEDDSAHTAAAAETGFWGRQGAGCIVFAKSTKRFLLAYRSEYVMEGNTWGTWGGAIDSNEDPRTAVVRELKEETEFHSPISKIIPLYIFKKSDFQYFNFVVIIEDEYEPDLNWENSGFKWCALGEFPSPLHFGLQSLLKDGASMSTLKKLSDIQ